MNKVAGYAAVFSLGFASCALLVRLPALQTFSPNRGRALPSLAEGVARIEPAVVNITVSRSPEASPFASEGQWDGAGSGILVSADGYVVTNNHVIAPAGTKMPGVISVRLDNGRVFDKVKIVGRDPQTDLAVLKVNNAKNLPFALWGDSDALQVGDWAIAVGNPLGFNSSVSVGIVSALNRRGIQSGGETVARVIQTDAAINPGNSGGALADADGRVVGVNTAIASSTGATVGIGFAIPASDVRPIVDALIRDGRVQRPYLGVVYVPLLSVEPRALPSGVTLPTDYGAVVYSEKPPAVVPHSPAAKAGLQTFDVLREIDGHKIGDTRDLRTYIQSKRIGDTVGLSVWRSGRLLALRVALEAMPEGFDTSLPSVPREIVPPGQMPGLLPESPEYYAK